MEIADYERRFRADGLPLLIEDYRASEDVWTRALPLLTLIFMFEVFGALNFSWPLAANVAAVVGGAVVLLTGFGIANRLQGRPFWSRPTRVSKPELIAFILVPALLPLVFGGQWRSAMVTAIVNIVTLWLIYFVVGYGVFAILSWTGRRMFTQLATSLQLLSKALPLVMLTSLILFFTAEMWQVFADLKVRVIVLVSILVLGLGVLFILVRIPAEVTKLQGHSVVGEPLTKRQRMNVGLVMFLAQALQIAVVIIGIGLFFVLLGSIAVTPHVQEVWTVADAPVLWEVDVWGVPVRFTRQLLVVSSGLAALGGLYFSISVLTDATYRQEFHEQLIEQMEETFRLRGEYLRLLQGGSAAAPVMPTG